MQSSCLRPLQEDHLDWLRPACGAGPRRDPAREPLRLPLNQPQGRPGRGHVTQRRWGAQMKAVVVGGVAGGMSGDAGQRLTPLRRALAAKSCSDLA